MDISFVILTWNSENYIEKCITNIVEETNRSNLLYEIFVVDNASKDGTKMVLSSLCRTTSNIKCIFLNKNYGTTYPRNLALKMAIGKYVCLIDSDAYPMPGCLNTLTKCLDANPEIGIVVPKLIYPDGRTQKSIDHFPTIWRKIQRTFFLRHLEAKESSWPRGPVPYAISAFWMMPYKILKEVGFLDENIYYAPEDADYCLEVWGKGYCVFFEPEAVAVHDAQEKSRSILPNKHTLFHIMGLFYMFFKHKYFFSPPLNIYKKASNLKKIRTS